MGVLCLKVLGLGEAVEKISAVSELVKMGPYLESARRSIVRGNRSVRHGGGQGKMVKKAGKCR